MSPSGIGCGGKLVELEKYVTHFFGDKLKRDAGIGVSVGEKGRGLSEESLSSTMTFLISSSTFSVAKLALACPSVKRDEDCPKSLCLQL